MLVFRRVTWLWMLATETLTSLNLTCTLQHELVNPTQLWERRTATHTREGIAAEPQRRTRHKNSGCFAIAPRVATETQPLLSWRCMFMLTQACDGPPLHHLKVISGYITRPFHRLLWSSDKPLRKTIPARISRAQRWPSRRLRNRLLVSPPFGEAAAVRTFSVSTLYYVPGRKYYCKGLEGISCYKKIKKNRKWANSCPSMLHQHTVGVLQAVLLRVVPL